MEIESYFAGARETQPVGAVVLHRLRDRHVGVWHDIDSAAPGAPQLGPGRLLTHDAVRDLAQRLSGGSNVRAILPACILVADTDLLVWHRPALRRPIIFDTADKKLNADVSGQPVLHPPLLFVARPGKLSIHALANDYRPEMTTPLFRAPYFNTYASGAMCEGSVPLPPAPLPTEAVLDGYEAAFYDSAFVHTNLGHTNITAWPGGHGELWREMTKPEYVSCHFPEQALVPLRQGGKPLKVAAVLESAAVAVDMDAAGGAL